MKQSLNTLLNSLTKKLGAHYDNEEIALQNALVIIEFVTQKTHAQLLLEDQIELSDAQSIQLTAIVYEITSLHKPIQYIIGSIPFLDLTLKIVPPILIPRPETEEWCDTLIKLLKKNRCEPQAILDLCTGSGCIALALAQAFPDATVTGADINPQAIDLARTNKKINGITNATFILSDLFNQLPPDASFDLIISNPPYLSHDEWTKTDPEIALWEDPLALEAPDNGYALIKRIIKESKHRLTSTCSVEALWIEIGHLQGPVVIDFALSLGYKKATINKDIYGKDRVVKIGI